MKGVDIGIPPTTSPPNHFEFFFAGTSGWGRVPDCAETSLSGAQVPREGKSGIPFIEGVPEGLPEGEASPVTRLLDVAAHNETSVGVGAADMEKNTGTEHTMENTLKPMKPDINEDVEERGERVCTQ